MLNAEQQGNSVKPPVLSFGEMIFYAKKYSRKALQKLIQLLL